MYHNNYNTTFLNMKRAQTPELKDFFFNLPPAGERINEKMGIFDHPHVYSTLSLKRQLEGHVH
jgi:hypothetical protein